MNQNDLNISREKNFEKNNSINTIISSSVIQEELKDYQKQKIISDAPIVNFEMLKQSIKNNNIVLTDKLFFYEDSSCLIEIKNEDDFFNILEYHKTKNNNSADIYDDFNIVLKQTNNSNNKLNQTLSNDQLTSFSLSISNDSRRINKFEENHQNNERNSSEIIIGSDKFQDNNKLLKNLIDELLGFKRKFYENQEKIFELIDKKIENKFHELVKSKYDNIIDYENNIISTRKKVDEKNENLTVFIEDRKECDNTTLNNRDENKSLSNDLLNLGKSYICVFFNII
jgi:hypothetical protein